jgi:hypothetical protein
LGHIWLGRLPRTRKWREVVDLLQSGASVESVVAASAGAAKVALGSTAKDPLVLTVSDLMARLPHEARGSGYHVSMSPRDITDLGNISSLFSGG